MIRRLKILMLAAVACAAVSGCGIYSFSGTSIQPDVKSIAVEYFKNNALKPTPPPAPSLADAFIAQHWRRPSLQFLPENGDRT